MQIPKSTRRFRYVVLSFALFTIATVFSRDAASASRPRNPEATPASSTEICLTCHETPNVHINLASGEQLNLSIDGTLFEASIHGQNGVTCTQCHTTISGYPHPELEVISQREFTVAQNRVCADCHEDSSQESLTGVHQSAQDGGNLGAAVCSDCHGSHEISSLQHPLDNFPQICSTCHDSIYELYKASVHGEALLGGGNPDVPSCIDCHGAHAIKPANQDQFHLFSPLICANCHTDEKIVEKYDLNPLVFETYVADFHGTTVTLFEEISPDQKTNKPVCIDCHGVHDIRRTDDPESRVIQENLLTTCQRCHPDASDDFPGAWLSHYQPSWDKTPIVASVDLFYRIFIPATVFGMLVFLIPDSLQRIRRKFTRQKNGKTR